VSSPAGQRWGNSSRSRRGHPIGHLVQSITEQIAVLIKRRGRRRVPNGDTWTVTATHPDGSLTVTNTT